MLSRRNVQDRRMRVVGAASLKQGWLGWRLAVQLEAAAQVQDL